MKIYIENDPLFYPEIKYIFSVFCANKGIQYGLVSSKTDADLIISNHEQADVRISKEFFIKLQQRKFDHSHHFIKQCFIVDTSGYIDYLSTAFYILSTIQEIDNKNVDEYGRYKYLNSFQYKFGNVKENIVQNIFDKLFNSIEKLNKPSKQKSSSKIFLSHDIDSVYGSVFQDSFFNVKKLRFNLALKVILYNIFTKPMWLNMDKIMKIESEYDFYSTFYWLVNKGKVTKILSNSDYNITNNAIRTQINSIEKSKWENGLHKSGTTDSFKVEIQKLGIDVKGNRFHYLKFNPHVDFLKIEEAGLFFDTSLGFAESYGFRNGYGRPYFPYNMTDRKSFGFIECPLNIMDTTFFKYMKVTSSEFVKCVIDFCENNKDECIISVLFHNNYISEHKFRNYFIAFKELLSYFYESGFDCITQTEIINQFKNEYSN